MSISVKNKLQSVLLLHLFFSPFWPVDCFMPFLRCQASPSWEEQSINRAAEWVLAALCLHRLHWPHWSHPWWPHMPEHRQTFYISSNPDSCQVSATGSSSCPQQYQQSLTEFRTLCPLPGSVFAPFAKISKLHGSHAYQKVITSATGPPVFGKCDGDPWVPCVLGQ